MRLLLDTHALLWWTLDDPILSPSVREAIYDSTNEVFVSAVSAVEISTKHRIGKLPDAAPLVRDFEAIIAQQGFAGLPLTLRHGRIAGGLEGAHKDPFDRMLIAQALVEDMVLASNEALFDGFGVVRLW